MAAIMSYDQCSGFIAHCTYNLIEWMEKRTVRWVVNNSYLLNEANWKQ